MCPENWRVTVIGAGVVGLTTATFLQDALPNIQITIIADKFLTETTSDGAAGLYHTSLSFTGPTKEITMKWLTDSFKYFSNFIEEKGTKKASDAGIETKKIYGIATEDPRIVRNFHLEAVLDDFRLLTAQEIRSKFHTNKYKYGSVCTSVLAECRKYLPFLTKRFEERGGTIVQRRIQSFDEVADDCDILFNCTGLGAKYLCNDYKMVSIRGQVYQVQAPWVESAVYMDTDTYIIPMTGGRVTLGGTRQFDSTNKEIDVHDSAGIWERCISVIPSLKDARVERQWVGLRPYRTEVRVEKEIMTLKNGKTLKVIHNYGHGGYGVMTSPGTSMHAVSLGIEALRDNFKSNL